MSNLSRKQLIAFLEWTGEKGLMKKTTADSLKSACNNVLSVMDEEEAQDVSRADLDTLIQRYQNLHSLDVSPATMNAYDKRVRYAIGEFLKYDNDKVGWKPSGGQRSTNAAQPPRKVKSSNRKQEQPGAKEPTPPNEIFDASNITHQFPIRRDMVVTVKGIPFDVKRSEMSRLNAFLANLVAVSEDDGQLPFMLNAPSPDDIN